MLLLFLRGTDDRCARQHGSARRHGPARPRRANRPHGPHRGDGFERYGAHRADRRNGHNGRDRAHGPHRRDRFERYGADRTDRRNGCNRPYGADGPHRGDRLERYGADRADRRNGRDRPYGADGSYRRNRFERYGAHRADRRYRSGCIRETYITTYGKGATHQMEKKLTHQNIRRTGQTDKTTPQTPGRYDDRPGSVTICDPDGKKYIVTRHFAGDKEIGRLITELARSRADRETGLL